MASYMDALDGKHTDGREQGVGMTSAQKAAKLREAIALMQEADALVQQALGDTDASLDLHHGIDELIDELAADVQDLEARAAGGVL